MKRSALVNRLRGLLEAYGLENPEDGPAVSRFFEFLDSGEELQGKSNPARHITASAWVVNLSRSKVLLTHHAKLNIWVQLGGHTDPGEDWASAALREAKEESGLLDLALAGPAIFDLDIHTIPGRTGTPSHEHYDLRFLIIADDEQPLTLSDESHDLAWVALTDLKAYTDEWSQHRMARKTLLRGTTSSSRPSP